MKISITSSQCAFAITVFLLSLLTACGGATNETAVEVIPTESEVQEPFVSSLVALPGYEDSVPEITEKTTVLMQTDIGDLTIEVYPQAAPNAAARFLELVEAGFYDNTAVFRVVSGFVAQFGINWRDDFPSWQDNNFNDDPVLFSHERGTLAFAKAGPNTNSTQVFINYTENNRLAAPNLNFTVFAVVVGGMDVADNFVPVGDPNGGLDQERLWSDGGVYLDSLATKPVMINAARIVP